MPKSITYSVQMSLAGALVAAIILIDLATGQGPPALNAYMAQPVPPAIANGYGPPPAPNMGYLQGPPMHYEHMKDHKDKEYEKEQKLEEKEHKSLFHPFGGSSSHEKAKFEKLEKEKYDKEREKYDKEREKDYGFYKHYEDKSTPAPGVFSSLSNGMSGAWKSVTGLGRRKRSADEETSKSKVEPTSAKADVTASSSSGDKSSGRSIADWERPNYDNQGYVFFKVPKNLICYNQY